jgi:hypothetical protein
VIAEAITPSFGRKRGDAYSSPARCSRSRASPMLESALGGSAGLTD